MAIVYLSCCFRFFGLLLLVVAIPISVVLFAEKKKRAALKMLCIPGGMVALSFVLPLIFLILGELHNRSMSAQPDRLFEMTFAFWPPPEMKVLEGYYELGLDSLEKALQFRAPPEIVDRIRGRRFIASNRETFVSECNHMPDQVRSWFLPAVEQADCFYIARPFDDSFGTYNQAILCYNRETGIACFHWMGAD